ncbi:MAG: hypothetical protein JXR70_09430 [Spirochaetales bacterium]|nr:hypothetical protein [Spirochaetales bacterium]
MLRAKKCLFPAILIILASNTLYSQTEGFGAGIILGEPSGLTAKFWINNQNALDLAVAWSLVSEMQLHVHGDYLFHFLDLFPVPKGYLPLYVGAGARAKITAVTPQIGIRAPVGLAYLFENAPIEIFLEIAFIMDLFPATNASGGGGIGIRYFF